MCVYVGVSCAIVAVAARFSAGLIWVVWGWGRGLVVVGAVCLVCIVRVSVLRLLVFSG